MSQALSPPSTQVLIRACIRAADFPLAGLDAPVALAMILRTDGPSYRPVGTLMAVAADGTYVGSLSSGCIDADVRSRALAAAAQGVVRRLRYGKGSPFFDLQLPCGGGLEILVLPTPTLAPRTRIIRALAQRRRIWLLISQHGLELCEHPDAVRHPGPEIWAVLRIDPDPRFLVFGKGPEAGAFAAMTAAAGYDTYLASPDIETLETATRQSPALHTQTWPGVFPETDDHTAIVLFFHEHEREAEILARALRGLAFYIGAQGSQRTQARRQDTLRALGLTEAQIARVRGPIGLIPSTRDARTLAVSVLAEILAEAVAPG